MTSDTVKNIRYISGFFAIAAFTVISTSWSAFLISFLTSLGLSCIFLAAVFFFDILDPTKISTYLTAFFFGSTIVIGSSLVLNYALGDLFNYLTSIDKKFLVSNFIGPVVEELCKGIAIVFILIKNSKEIKNIIDVMMICLAVGIGFAFVENIFYFANSLFYDNQFFIPVIQRGIYSFLNHSIFIMPLGMSFFAAKKYKKYYLFPIGLVLSIILHMLWNYLSLFYAFYFVFLPALIVALCYIFFCNYFRSQLVYKHTQYLSKSARSYLCNPFKRAMRVICNIIKPKKAYHILIRDARLINTIIQKQKNINEK